FGDPRGHDPDPELARRVPFDDRNVGVADIALDAFAEVVERIPGRQGLGDRHAAYSGRRPQHHLRSAVLADDLGLDRSGADLEPFGEMNTKPKTVDQRASAEDAVVPGESTHQVGE